MLKFTAKNSWILFSETNYVIINQQNESQISLLTCIENQLALSQE